MSKLNYLPLPVLFFSLLVAILLVVVIVIELRLLQYAYMSLGMSARAAFLLLVASLAGSYINIAVGHLPARTVLSGETVSFFGMQYVIPAVVRWPGTVIAVNVGGAVIPTLLSLYLLVRHRIWMRALVATAGVAAICYFLASPVRGVGIAIPVFVPPVATAIIALLLSPRRAAPLAYISGSMGTLIGADLLNLGKIQGLGAPVASIGGAGTFDGIFLTCIVAVLLASIGRRPRTA